MLRNLPGYRLEVSLPLLTDCPAQQKASQVFICQSTGAMKTAWSGLWVFKALHRI